MSGKVVSMLALLLALSHALAQESQDNMKDELDTSNDQEEKQEPGEEPDITSRIMEANKRIYGYYAGFLMEGDVAVPRGRNARKCADNKPCLWEKSPSGLVRVPYRIAYGFSRAKRDIIKKAMETFHQKTCIRFVPQLPHEMTFLEIESREGCWSYVGKRGYRQVVSLNARGCVYHGIVQHELLHALGFYHEHTRSDRDQHVIINWRNVLRGYYGNFQKRDTNNLNTPYDYGSVMHYGRYFFSNRSGPTITPRRNPGFTLGLQQAMTEIDILKVNRLYECDVPK
ncbi:low choriolytic enzyme-like [Engraulis encrasicolus]